ncbi:MAG: hypothetical protein P9F75_19055 [Candidatus Contendobacter sp.]|nr:hypothetical protein [Candidatus Contendobacter sp.]
MPISSLPSSDEITVRFTLGEGDGYRPEKKEFSEYELSDMRTCMTMSICWEPSEMEENQDAKIIWFEVIYDGITLIKDKDYGIWLGYWFDEDDELCGHPCPIIRFKLDRKVKTEQFRRSIWTSSLRITTASREGTGEEPYYAEDHDGSTSILSKKKRDDWISFLKNNNVFCGKIFHFPNGLPEYGYSIPTTEFALLSSNTGADT